MFARNKKIMFIAVMLLSLVWYFAGVQIRPIQSSNRIQTFNNSFPDNAIKPALGPNVVPMAFPPTQQAKLLASDKATFDVFGASVSLSSDGNTALIGAYGTSDSGTLANGAAYIFTRSGGVWTQQTKLLASDKADSDEFGISVSLSSDGNTALVGADREDDGSTTDNGAAYIFIRSGGVWTQQAKFLASDKDDSDEFGISVSLSSDGNTAIVGADREDDGATTVNGAVYVFTRSGGVWTEQGKLLASDKASTDYFGRSVSLDSDGNIALIGAHFESDSGTSNNGAVYVFTRSGGVWTEQAKLLASDKANQDLFGGSVSLNGDGSTAIIGAYNEDDSGTTNNGAAYIFTRSGSVWTQQAKLLASDKANSDQFGYSVSLSSDGNAALISARGDSEGVTTGNGAAYIFTRTGGVWTQQAKLFAADKASSDAFSHSVSLSNDGNTVLIGAIYEDDGGATNNGAAYVFTDVLPPTPTPTSTPTSTLTPTPSVTPTLTPSNTATLTATYTNTPVLPRPDTIGVYKDGVFSLRNQNNTGVADITVAFGGDASDLPVAGDWNGDGVDTIGVYRGTTGVYLLSDSNTVPAVTYSLVFGNPGDTPFAGKWTSGATHDGVGVYRNSNGILYQKDNLTTGFSDYFAVFGNPGDQGYGGDFNGNGFDSIGIYRSSNQTWYMTNNSQPSGITFSDVNFVWNIGTARPVIGDWNGDNISTVGYFSASGLFDLHSTNASIGSDNLFPFGPTNAYPIAGKWIAASQPGVQNVIGGGIPNANPDTGNQGD